MNAVEHFAGYLTRASDARLKELTTIHVRGHSAYGGSSYWRLLLEAQITSGLQNMVLDEIERRWSVQYPLDKSA